MPADLDRLIAQTALGDRRAFAALYDRTSAKLFGVALRILIDRGEAEEALQEAYLKVWNKAESFATGEASAISWLAAVARNAAIDRLRRMKQPPAAPDVASLMADSAPDPEDALLAAEEYRRLLDCLEELEEAHRTMVRKAFFTGRTYADLASEAAMPLGTVKSWIRRSLMKLRDCLRT